MNTSLNNSSSNSSSKNSRAIDDITQENATQSNAIDIPAISLPKGGGALKGIDEKFEVNAANGTASFSIPLPISPGRNGFSPSLSLSYSSGAGNGPFGLGWSLDYPSIQRKTDKGIPLYKDGKEEDTFMIAGAEDLVPYLEHDSSTANYSEKITQTADGYSVKSYRPRIEGTFARIEKIHHANHETYWKVTSKDNIVTLYGRSREARIADPKKPDRILKWLPEFSYDDKGNWIKYHYSKDSNFNEAGALSVDDGIPNSLSEKNRKSGLAPFTNTYLKRISYGNEKPYYADPAKPYNAQAPAAGAYFFEIVLDYGEHDSLIPTPVAVNKWGFREDAFSTYRSGFEIRTYRQCRRILMFHHFESEKQFDGTSEEEAFGKNYLVRSMDFEYSPSSINDSGQAEVTYLKAITQSGYIRKPQHTGYSKKSLPPLSFTYQELRWNTKIKKISQEHLVNAPVGLTNNYHWVDLYGEGISGIFTEQDKGWYYKSNLGAEDQSGEPSFSVAKKVAPRPAFGGWDQGTVSLQDLEANGQKQLVVSDGDIKGYYQLKDDNDWEPYKTLGQVAQVDMQNPNMRLIDFNGDGRPDLVITEENVFIWYAADGKRGHLPAQYAPKMFNEEKGPAIVFADTTQSIFLADMAGDGLTDIVRIRNGEICYWANMGHGRFSAKINMQNAPLFDYPDSFDPQYLHLADISGTGATDILYLGTNTFKSFINLSGNAWSDVQEIDPFFPVDNQGRLSVIDLLGTGTSCIVWSSDLPLNGGAPMRYIDLMDSKKPHVLVHHKNNFGKETHIEYKSSTHYYLKDKKNGTPWITKLPFPVQVVSRKILSEKITDVRFSSQYEYHHGYFDHAEREFRGFGMVEQTDTEYYPEWKRDIATDQLERDEALFQKPVLTKTWLHTGAYLGRENILDHYKTEYWHAVYNKRFPLAALVVTEPELPESKIINGVSKLSADEYREAFRACKGMVLRQEVFALDAPDNPNDVELRTQYKPFSVATHNCQIQMLQPANNNKYGVFLVTESEAINIHYERDETDFRLTHTLNIETDDLGNILESASVMYGRNQTNVDADFLALSNGVTDFSEEADDAVASAKLKTAFNRNLDAAKDVQTKTRVIYSTKSFAKYKIGTTPNKDIYDIDLPNAYRLRLPFEAKTYEITGKVPPSGLFKIPELIGVVNPTSEVGYHESATTGVQSRCIEHIRTKYRKDDLTPLTFGVYDTLGLDYENYQLAYTPDLVNAVYAKKDGTLQKAQGKNIVDQMVTEGGFIMLDGTFWIRSGHSNYKQKGTEPLDNVKDRFFLPLTFEDPLGAISHVIYDNETFSGTDRNNDGDYLFIRASIDPLEHKSLVDVFNYRTLSPTRMIDMNGNPSSVVLDELGMVKAGAVEGNGSYTDAGRTAIDLIAAADDLTGITEYTPDSEKDMITQFFDAATLQSTDTAELRSLANSLLRHATTRFIYDLDTYYSTGEQPTSVATIVREEHFAGAPNSNIQCNFAYSDGLGNVAMVKKQAEPGLAYYMDDGVRKEKDTGTELRWLGNGRTVLNNKGNPVKQYEPFFSTTFFYENDSALVEIGLSPIQYYDALGRAIKTEYPNGTLTKIAIDSWKQRAYDQNDTVLESDWYKKRTDASFTAELLALGKDPVTEKTAALQAQAHADTPMFMVLDAMGRPVLNLGNNGKDTNGKDRLYASFVDLDIEGNAIKVIDAKGNTVMAYTYDFLGHRIYQESSDAGERWTYKNCLGKPVYTWDQRDHNFLYFYDSAHRPTHARIVGGDDSAPLDHIFERIIYGESLLTANRANEAALQDKNVLGKTIRHFDTGGVVDTLEFDFKGKPLSTNRRLFKHYKVVANWTDAKLVSDLENDPFTFSTQTDALGRIARQTAPNGDVIVPSYNETGLLNAETVTHLDPAITTTYIKNIDYNEKGQREKIVYGNDVSTKFYYDPETFRLTRLESKRQNNDPLQDWSYTFDAAGNITHVADRNIPVTFFANQKISGISTYSYDALYRLTNSGGRENDAALAFNNEDNWNDAPFTHLHSEGDPMAIRNYAQEYSYDAVGNIRRLKHTATGNTWTRNYAYEQTNNRLVSTKVGSQTYTYTHHGQHGFMIALPHLDTLSWNFKEELVSTVRQKVGAGSGTAETTYYQYDGGGQRIRKITENSATAGALPTKKEERIYVSGYELYIKHSGSHSGLERSTLSLLDGGHRFVMVETRNTINDGTDKQMVRYQLYNHLGSAAIELDATAQVISYEEYHPFGTTAYQAKNTAIKAVAKRYRYTGMERDEESGLSYHSARYYLPWLGRWLSTDTIGIGDGLNLYRYAGNDPVNHIDSKGTQSQDDDDVVVGSTGSGEPAPRRMVQGRAAVTPEVAESILRNISEGEPGFRPERGKGGASWFVSEGEPYTGRTNNPVTIETTIDATDAIRIESEQLTEIHRSYLDNPEFEAEMEAEYRNREGIAEGESMSNRVRSQFTRFLRRAAESRMWDQVGRMIRQSPSQVGEVILEGSEFSRSGDGRFVLTTDPSKITVEAEAVITGMEDAGLSVEPHVREAADATMEQAREANRIRNVGRVRAAFRIGGRILLVYGIANDAYRIYNATDRMRTSTEVAGGWAGGLATAGVFSAWFLPADAAGPWAWAAHGVGGFIAFGVGYWGGSTLAGEVYELTVEGL